MKLGYSFKLLGLLSLMAPLSSLTWAQTSTDKCNERVSAQDWQGAVMACNQALNENPKSAENWVNRGTAWFQLQDLNAALRDMNKAISFDGRLSIAYYNRGLIYQAQNANDLRACTDWDAAMQLGDKDALTLLLSNTCKGKKYNLAKLPAATPKVPAATPAPQAASTFVVTNPEPVKEVAPAKPSFGSTFSNLPQKSVPSIQEINKKSTLTEDGNVYKVQVFLGTDLTISDAQQVAIINVMAQAVSNNAAIVDSLTSDVNLSIGADEARVLLWLALKMEGAEPQSSTDKGRLVVQCKNRITIDKDFLGKAALTVSAQRAGWAEWFMPMLDWDNYLASKPFEGNKKSSNQARQMLDYINQFKSAIRKNL